MSARPRKSSRHVTLVLLGAAALAGCGGADPDTTVRRDVYASKEDCMADWRDPGECEAESAPSKSDGVRHSYWYGPAYGGRSSASTGGYHPGAPRPGSRALGTHSTTRGGFGASGRAHGTSAT